MVPQDFAAELERAGVRPAFDALAYSYRKQVRPIASKPNPDATRQHRIAKAIDADQGDVTSDEMTEFIDPPTATCSPANP